MPMSRFDQTILGRVRLAWQDVLGFQPSPDDNFFDVGGDSLLIILLQEKVRARTGADIAIGDLFRAPSAATQAELIDQADRATRASARSPEPEIRKNDIAIIGMACHLAGSADKDEFWRNLLAGHSLIATSTEPVFTEMADGAVRVPRWGMLPEGTGYDAPMLGLAAEEESAADPQHGILYECLWAAVEDAGLTMAAIGPGTSLYVTAERNNENIDLGTRERPTRAEDIAGSSATFLASRFSYLNGLEGESLYLDTGCSSSLVAVHLACGSLLRGDSDYALVGGVSVEAPDDGGYTFVPGHSVAHDGVCRPFDASATGTVGGDGAGAVLLRRLGDAVRDGDPVYGVIRGSAVNNDGSARVGYTAPGVEGHVRVIRKALAAAGVDGSEIDYVEPHGTGTRLGDAIEAIALAEALGPEGPMVAVGGLKASIGHIDVAAGLASLIKAVLAVHHGYLPATPGVSRPIGEFDGTRLTLVPSGRAWPDRERLRTAGVSAIGVGGTNGHIIVQEFPQIPGVPTAYGQASRIIALSAHTPTALAAARERLAAHLQSRDDVRLDDVAATLASGRYAFHHRLAFVTDVRDQAVSMLSGSAPRCSGTAPDGRQPSLVFAFGDTVAGEPFRALAAALTDTDIIVRWLERADTILAGLTPMRVTEWLHLDRGDAALTERAIAVPATVAVAYALAQQFIAWGVFPRESIGTGAGALTAAALNGSLGFDDAILNAVRYARNGVPMAAEDAQEKADVCLAFGAVPEGLGDDTIVIGADKKTTADVLVALAGLWCLGVPVDLSAVSPGRRIHLPAYPFERTGDGSGSADAGMRALTALEQRLIYHDLVRTSDNSEHTVVAAAAFEDVSVDVIREGFAKVQVSHPRLRTVYRRAGNRWSASISPDPALLHVQGPDDPVFSAQDLKDRLAGHRFAPTSPSLLRGLLATDRNGRAFLGLAAHRAVASAEELDDTLQELVTFCLTGAVAPALREG